MARVRARTYVVTGSASGIGRATAELLETEGARVIRVDLQDGDVLADVASPAGRDALVAGVRAASDGTVDAVIACAGVLAAGADRVVGVNYFGTVATLEGLRPLLAAGVDPRAVAVSSRAILRPPDDDLVDACLDGDEPRAVAVAAGGNANVYACAKLALARWIRREAPTPSWAGAGITLNAIAPGAIRTPMIEEKLATDRDFQEREREWMPLGGPGTPAQVAPLLVWLTSPANSLVTGQVVFVDGGSDAVIRGDDIW